VRFRPRAMECGPAPENESGSLACLSPGPSGRKEAPPLGERSAAGPSHGGHDAMSHERHGHCPFSIVVRIALSVS
jgi:hypothetical protein